MISIYLFTNKNFQFIFNKWFDSIFIFKKIIYTYFIKIIFHKISIWQQKLFLFAFTRKKKRKFTTLFTKILQFDFTYKWINLFTKRNIFNPILLKKLFLQL